MQWGLLLRRHWGQCVRWRELVREDINSESTRGTAEPGRKGSRALAACRRRWERDNWARHLGELPGLRLGRGQPARALLGDRGPAASSSAFNRSVCHALELRGLWDLSGELHGAKGGIRQGRVLHSVRDEGKGCSSLQMLLVTTPVVMIPAAVLSGHNFAPGT